MGAFPFFIYAFIAGIFVVYFVVRALRRPSWRMQPHYKTLAARIAQPLLLTAEEAAPRDWPLAQLSFDHANNMGRTRYIIRIDLPGRPCLPKHITLHPFKLPREVTYEHEGRVLFNELMCDHRAHFFRIKSFEFITKLCTGISLNEVLDYLDEHKHLNQREHTYEHATQTLSMSFYIEDDLFLAQGDMPDAERINELVALISPLLDMLDKCAPSMRTEAQKWIALYHIAIPGKHALYCLSHELADHSKAPEFDAFWDTCLERDDFEALNLLFVHDRALPT